MMFKRVKLRSVALPLARGHLFLPAVKVPWWLASQRLPFLDLSQLLQLHTTFGTDQVFLVTGCMIVTGNRGMMPSCSASCRITI